MNLTKIFFSIIKKEITVEIVIRKKTTQKKVDSIEDEGQEKKALKYTDIFS